MYRKSARLPPNSKPFRTVVKCQCRTNPARIPELGRTKAGSEMENDWRYGGDDGEVDDTAIPGSVPCHDFSVRTSKQPQCCCDTNDDILQSQRMISEEIWQQATVSHISLISHFCFIETKSKLSFQTRIIICIIMTML